MARPLRIEFPGAFYHVMNRGNTGMDIYRSERDREKFLEYAGEALKRYGIKVHTDCLMTTHYHFLIETPHANPGCGDLSLQGNDGRNQRRLGPAVRYLRSWNRGSA